MGKKIKFVRVTMDRCPKDNEEIGFRCGNCEHRGVIYESDLPGKKYRLTARCYYPEIKYKNNI